jgi:hypothetical protein
VACWIHPSDRQVNTSVVLGWAPPTGQARPVRRVGGRQLQGHRPGERGPAGRVDVIHTSRRTDDGGLVWALVDARESETLSVERLGLVALNATATVRADFREADRTRV